MATQIHRLARAEKGKELGGVCAGIAKYFDLDVSVVRLLFLLAWLMAGFGFVLYIILWLVLPSERTVAKEHEEIINENAAEIKEKAEQVVNPIKKHATKTRTKLIVGIIIIMIGVVALLRSFGFLININFGWLWPSILIIIGIILLFGRNE